MFHSRKDARKALVDIAKAKGLCLKVLGLEALKGRASRTSLGHCKGACVGKEPPVLHAVRVQMALSSLKFKSWPFPGRVALIERGPMGAVDSHVLDRWTYLGTARCEDELASLTRSAAPAVFDAQVYRILVRYLKNHTEARMARSGSRFALRAPMSRRARERQRPLLDRDGAGRGVVGARRGARGSSAPSISESAVTM